MAERPRIRDPVAEVLDEIQNEHEYGSRDEAITHALREAGYDV
jgi:metal-responsive CopG/Arc/MetJ family transcriptional regulator